MSVALIQRVLAATSHYDVLQVAPTATLHEIRQAYRRLALEVHPDKTEAEGSTDAFIRISEAFATLRDAEKRQLYDLERATSHSSRQYETETADSSTATEPSTRAFADVFGGHAGPSNPYGVPSFFDEQPGATNAYGVPSFFSSELGGGAPSSGGRGEENKRDTRSTSGFNTTQSQQQGRSWQSQRPTHETPHKPSTKSVSTWLSIHPKGFSESNPIQALSKWKALWLEECQRAAEEQARLETLAYDARTRELEQAVGLQLFGQVGATQRAQEALNQMAIRYGDGDITFSNRRRSQANVLRELAGDVWSATPNDRLTSLLGSGVTGGDRRSGSNGISDRSVPYRVGSQMHLIESNTRSSITRDSGAAILSLGAGVGVGVGSSSGSGSASSRAQAIQQQAAKQAAKQLRAALEALVSGERMHIKARARNQVIPQQSSSYSRLSMASQAHWKGPGTEEQRVPWRSSQALSERDRPGATKPQAGASVPRVKLEVGDSGETLVPVSVWLSSDFQRIQWRLVGSQNSAPDGIVNLSDIVKITRGSNSDASWLHILTPTKTLSLRASTPQRAEMWTGCLDMMLKEANDKGGSSYGYG